MRPERTGRAGGHVEPVGSRGRAWSASDAGTAALLAFAAGVLYHLTSQARLTIDGAGLLGQAVLGTGGTYYNVLYHPLLRLVALPFGGPSAATVHLASTLFAAVAVGAAYLVVRWFRLPAGASLLVTVLWALSPALWFYGTTIETHAVHAGVAGLVVLCTLVLPWRRPGLALPLAALLLLPLFWTQQIAILLGPGWVLLVAAARARVAAPFRVRTLLFVVGPVLLAGFVVALALANLRRFGTLAPEVQGQLAQIAFDHHPDPTWWTEWIAPLGVLVPLGLAGLCFPRATPALAPLERSAIALLLVPAIAFFSWWGVWERGGYFLGSDPFLLVPAGHLLHTLATRTLARRSLLAFLLGALLLGSQGLLGRQTVASFDSGWDPARRTAVVRAAIGDEGLLLATSDAAPPIAIYLPHVEELQVWEAAKQVLIRTNGSAAPDSLVPWILPRVDRALAAGRRVALELGWRASDSRPIERPTFALLDAIAAALRDHYDTRLVADRDWPLLLLEERAR